MRHLLLFYGVLSASVVGSASFSFVKPTTARAQCTTNSDRASPSAAAGVFMTRGFITHIHMTDKGRDDPKFGFGQRIESAKCLVIGGLAGSIAMAPVSFLHNFLLLKPINSLAQWEFDTDMGALEAGLFAIVYRYSLRQDTNPQLASGCVGAFVLVRTLARIETPQYCSAIPLDCGAPFGYFDWSMTFEAVVNGAESAALFGAAAAAIDYVTKKGFLSKFPG